MSGYSVDVKATHLVTDGDIFAGPARVLGIYCPNGAYAELTGGVDKVTIFYG